MGEESARRKGRCPCGVAEFRLRVDAVEGIGLATCTRGHSLLMLDSRDHWLDAIQERKPRELKCRCGHRSFALEFKYALEDGGVRSVKPIARCTACAARIETMSVDIDYEPTALLLERPLDPIDDPWSKPRRRSLTALWRREDALDFVRYAAKEAGASAWLEVFQMPPRRVDQVELERAVTSEHGYLAAAFSTSHVDVGASLRDAWKTGPFVQLSSPTRIHYETGVGSMYYVEWAEEVLRNGAIERQSDEFSRLAARIEAFLRERFVSTRGRDACDAPSEYARLKKAD